MRTFKKTVVLLCLGISNAIFSQSKPDSLGLPGDNFDLYGALDAFKSAKTPEDLEKALNAKDNDINNLDLDGNGKVDYIKVIDKQEKDGHTLILQTAVSETETQDIAVIEVEKTGADKAHVQIVGDEELYGKDYIVEPADENAKKNAEKKEGAEDDVYSNSDNSNRETSNTTNPNYSNNDPNTNVVVNVWGWPSVQYIYAPAYVGWVSPWYWGYYPPYWNPWQPMYWHYHHRRAYHYHHGFYHRANFYRSPGVHSFYYGRRASSGVVRRNRESGFYQKRQMDYKRNAVPGRKYNNRPADRTATPRVRENTPRRNNEASPVRPSREPVRNNTPVKDRNTTQPVKTPRETKPRIERQPTSTPRSNAEPRRQGTAPQQRAPQQRSNGGGGQRRTR
ncbi:MAG: hypothetical protein V4580_01590 [Bacteroidota bacterium]